MRTALPLSVRISCKSGSTREKNWKGFLSRSQTHTLSDTHRGDEHDLKLKHCLAETSTKKKELINRPMRNILKDVFLVEYKISKSKVVLYFHLQSF